MNKTALILTTIIFIFSAMPAQAFYSRGNIDSYLAYDDMELQFTNYSGYVVGTLKNKTSEKITVFIHVYFCDIFNKWSDKSYIQITIPAYGEKGFKDYLRKKNRNARNAYKLIWEYEFLKVGDQTIINRLGEVFD